MNPTRYHPLLVSLHWIIVLLVLMNLGFGLFALKFMPNTEAKIVPLQIHMASGITILVLMVVRLVVRFATKHPPLASTGVKLLDWVGVAVHWLLYLFVTLMAISGLGIAAQAGLAPIVFQGSGNPLPQDFFAFPARTGHGLVGTVLLVLIALHVGAWAFHQFVKGDNLFARMWYGKR